MVKIEIPYQEAQNQQGRRGANDCVVPLTIKQKFRSCWEKSRKRLEAAEKTKEKV